MDRKKELTEFLKKTMWYSEKDNPDILYWPKEGMDDLAALILKELHPTSKENTHE